MPNAMKEDIRSSIEGILKNEQFKMDTQYFCEIPAENQNPELMKACESYLREAENPGKDRGKVKQRLIAALEEEGRKESENNRTEAENSLNIQMEIGKILRNKDLL
ncbi:MAG: hypothetical protein PUC44_03280 [Eubacteriales bacterium]|nr:hypothetical protein [Eubacteriales bacterium]